MPSTRGAGAPGSWRFAPALRMAPHEAERPRVERCSNKFVKAVGAA